MFVLRHVHAPCHVLLRRKLVQELSLLNDATGYLNLSATCEGNPTPYHSAFWWKYHLQIGTSRSVGSCTFMNKYHYAECIIWKSIVLWKHVFHSFDLSLVVKASFLWEGLEFVAQAGIQYLWVGSGFVNLNTIWTRLLIRGLKHCT